MSNLWKALRDVSRDVDPTIGFEPPVEASQIPEAPEVPEVEIPEPHVVVLDQSPVFHSYAAEPSRPAEPEPPAVSWPPPSTRVRPPKNYVTKDSHAAPIRSLIEREPTTATTAAAPARPTAAPETATPPRAGLAGAARTTPRPVPDSTTGPANGNGNGNGDKHDQALTSTPAATASPGRPVRPPGGINTPTRNRTAVGNNGGSNVTGHPAKVVPPATPPSTVGDAVLAGPTSRRPGSPRQPGSSGQVRQPSSTPPLRPNRSIAHAALDFSSPPVTPSAPDSPASPPSVEPEPSGAAAAPAPAVTGAPRRSPARAAASAPTARSAAAVRQVTAAAAPQAAAPAATEPDVPAEAAPAVAPPAARPYARAVTSPTPAPTPAATPTAVPTAEPGLTAGPSRWSPPILNEPDVVTQALVNPDWKPGDDDVIPKGGKRPRGRLRDRLGW